MFIIIYDVFYEQIDSGNSRGRKVDWEGTAIIKGRKENVGQGREVQLVGKLSSETQLGDRTNHTCRRLGKGAYIWAGPGLSN